MKKFDIDAFVAECLDAWAADGAEAVKEVLDRALRRPTAIRATFGPPTEAGLQVLYPGPELVIENMVWAPGMTYPPHNHRTVAITGVYAGLEINDCFHTIRLPAGARLVWDKTVEIRDGDSFLMGHDAIHRIANPNQRRFTGAFHIFTADYLHASRSIWYPADAKEVPQSWALTKDIFAAANRELEKEREQLIHRVDPRRAARPALPRTPLDETWFEAFVRTTTPLMIGMLRHTFPDHRGLAEDIVNAAEMACWRNWSTKGVPGNPQAYLRTVVLRLAGKVLSAEEKLEKVVFDEEAPMAAMEDSTEPDVAAAAVEAAFAQLTPRQREIMKLVLDGRKHKQIAEQLGLTEGTVGATVHQARVRLRKLLGIEHGKERDDR